ncbi:hypothetical protein [Neobacillus cucumis]|uniref:hypothetical protein n=1 Tax=Neobacillus cucumis TaxID=1740721 RepID=UPI002853341E|nr:hypothetical protein [Neobacillus cucumis]MDR4949801.1 hypothetical protein [Neobacillus cucumis]
MVQNPANLYVDPDGASYNVFFGTNPPIKKKILSQVTVGQSFVVDYRGNFTNPNLYVAQCRNKSISGDRGAEHGDLVINKLDASGKVLGTGMYLNHFHIKNSYESSPGLFYEGFNNNIRAFGFGHGSQIAIEYAPDATYIWTDCLSEVIDTVKTVSSKRYDVAGDGLCRFIYKDGSFTPNSPEIQVFTPIDLFGTIGANYTNLSISIDNEFQRMAVKYKDNLNNGKYYAAVFQIAYIGSKPTFTLLNTILYPVINWWQVDDNGPINTLSPLPNQGMSLFGNFLYTQHGTAYHHANFFSPSDITENDGVYPDGTPILLVGNHHITQVDWSSGTMVDVNHSQAYQSLDYREPEGLFMIPTKDATGNITALELCFGYASGPVGARRWTLYSIRHTGIQ